MRKSIAIAMSIALAAAAAAAPTNAALRTAQAADSAYRMGNYTEAAIMYEQVLQGGYASADLYYNLGNTYYRTEQTARAILNYERALRLRPTMRDAKENLALAESRTTDRITQLPELFAVRWMRGLTQHVPPRTWRVVLLVLLAVVGAGVVALRLGREASLRKGGLAAAAVGTLLAAATVGLLLSATRYRNTHTDAIVMDQAVAIKASPEWQSIDKMILHEGTKVSIEEALSGWYKIRIADGTTGWCENQSVERI